MAEKGYVFISYSSKDISFVEQLIKLFQDNGISYWKAPEMIPAGSNYAKEIPKAIDSCDVFVLVLSETSQNSIWVEKEVDVAICSRKKMIPIMIDETPLNDLYRFYLNNVQMISLPLESEVAIEQKAVWDKILNIITQKIKECEDDRRIRASAGETLQDEAINKDSYENQKEILKENSKYVFSDSTQKREGTDVRSNALRMNKIPIVCEFCGNKVQQTSLGVYKCISCERENYDDFQKVRNYLEKAGTAPVRKIAQNTGVAVQTIEYFWSNDYFREAKEKNGKNNLGT